MTRRRPAGTMIAAARAMAANGASAAEIRAAIVDAYGAPVANNIVSRMRADGDLPRRAAKLTSMHLQPTPAVRERLRRLAEKRGVSHHRVMRQALLAGLGVLEERL